MESFDDPVPRVPRESQNLYAPSLLIHGYSAESPDITLPSVQTEYGSLPNRLKAKYAAPVTEISLCRYISLDDGVTIDDILFQTFQNSPNMPVHTTRRSHSCLPILFGQTHQSTSYLRKR